MPLIALASQSQVESSDPDKNTGNQMNLMILIMILILMQLKKLQPMLLIFSRIITYNCGVEVFSSDKV
jgi:hypothetical protein